MAENVQQEYMRKNHEMSIAHLKLLDGEYATLQAKSLWVLFVALKKEGFSNSQAFSIVLSVAGGSGTGTAESGGDE